MHLTHTQSIVTHMQSAFLKSKQTEDNNKVQVHLHFIMNRQINKGILTR